jgi:hypothetical protein
LGAGGAATGGAGGNTQYADADTDASPFADGGEQDGDADDAQEAQPDAQSDGGAVDQDGDANLSDAPETDVAISD